MNRTKKLRSFSTYSFIKRFIISRYGQIPFAELNDELGAELAQAGIEAEHRATLDCHLSERLFALTPAIFEPIFTRLFFCQLVAYVDGQRQTGIPIKDAIGNYLLHCGLSEDDLSLRTAAKIYDRYRYDKK